MTLRPALFLDRDGVVNEEVGYLHRWEHCRFVDGIASLLQTANRLGYFTCVVTNQAGIARGMYTEADFHTLMDHMRAALLREGARLDAVYFSPFHPEHGIGVYRRESSCRKPAPGMILRAAADHGLDLARSVLVGDRCTDLMAGHAAGIQRLFLLGTTEDTPCALPVPYTSINALNAVEQMLREEAVSFASPGPEASRPK
jgi:D-glycero-D-manno-heptose 1,7-bisphosphate phosphatase